MELLRRLFSRHPEASGHSAHARRPRPLQRARHRAYNLLHPAHRTTAGTDGTEDT